MTTQYVLVLEALGVDEATFAKDAAAATGYEVAFAAEEVAAGSVVGLVTVKTTVTREVMERYQSLQFIAVAFTGYDCVDLEAARELDVIVTNVPTYATASVAELVVSLAIALLRTIPAHDAAMKAGEWTQAPGQHLAGKTVGIIGTGTIGVLTASYFKHMGCEVIGWSRSQNDGFAKVGDYRTELNQLLAEADIVSLHVPLTDATKGMIDAGAFSAMKPTAYLINTARGPVVDEEALTAALRDKTIAGAALDVFATEPLPASSELRTVPNMILTPHIAFNTKEALVERARVTIENMAAFQAGTPHNVVT